MKYEEYKVKRVLNNYGEKTIALTFDDGPVASTTAIVDMLTEVGIHATFFVLGDETSRRPEVLKYVHDHGHAIGNHSWNHPTLLGFRLRRFIESEVTSTTEAIKSSTDQNVRFFRSPFGFTGPLLKKILREDGVTEVLWTLSLKDWKLDTTAEKIATGFKNIKGSEVILLHDRAYSDPEKLQALKDAILDLKARGYNFVTIPELYR